MHKFTCYLISFSEKGAKSECKSTLGSASSNKDSLSLSAAIALVVFSRYWVMVCMLVPPVFYAFLVRRRNFHRRGIVSKNISGKKSRHDSAKTALEALLDSVRFLFGILGGSLVLSSGHNLYGLATTTPALMLAAYYAVCVVISFLILRALQCFSDVVCKNISTVEVTVRYDDDEEEEDDGDE